MALTKTTSISGTWGSHPTITYSGTITVTRASSTTKTIKVVTNIVFSLNSGGAFASGYDLVVYGDTNGSNDTSGWTDRTLSGSAGWSYPTKRECTWTRSFESTSSSLNWKMYAVDSTDRTHNFKSKSSPLTKSFSIPEYSSGSGGEIGGGAILIGSNKITASITPTAITLGESATINLTATAGQNNAVNKITISGDGVREVDKVESSDTGWGNRVKSITVTPSQVGTSKQYTIGVYSNITENTVTKTLNLTVKNIVPVISDASVSPLKVNKETGGSVSIRATTNVTDSSGHANSFSYYVNGSLRGHDWLYTSTFVEAGDTITVKAYDGNTGLESSSSKSFTIQGYTPVKINSINITPRILKDNLSTPDLVNVIQQGSISVSNATSVEWYYKQSSTPSGLDSTSGVSLGVSGTSFSNLDMSQKVNKGYYYQIYAIASNSDDSESSNYSEKYQIPKDPGSPTFNKIIPKANPENGYKEIVQDNKIYYGSGVFIIWNNPVIESSQLPIAEIEMIYQSKRETDTNFGEIKTAQFSYHNILEEGETVIKNYPFTLESGLENGGGADLEVESLYETKIGIRITDILGQYTDTFYETKNYFKAESPEFGGNLVINQTTFRPFTCIENDVLTFFSSVARSNSQDKLLYFIECYIGDRKTTIELLDGIPISTEAFANATEDDENKILYPENPTGNDDIVVKIQNSTTVKFEVRNKYFKNKLLSSEELRTPKNNPVSIYNDDFTDVVYKISVKDDFDSRSTVYNSVVTSIKYIEAPSLKNNINVEIGINRYLQSENPFYDDSIILLNSLSDNNDRIVNPGESIIFKFKRARDYNGADYLTTMVGDVIQYNIYVSRNDDIVNNNYDKLDYTLLKTFNAALSSDGGDLRKAYPNDSNDEYYYLEYPLTTYQESKFVIFKIEAIDSKNQKSDFIYANTYLVPCRATSMDFHISNVRLYSDKVFSPSFKNKVNDFGASIFVNNKYNYNNYPNYERNYSVGTNNNKQQFNRQGYIIFEGSLNGDFNNEIISLQENQYSNYFSQTINLNNFLGGKKYPDILGLEYDITDFPQEWKIGLEKKDIKKIFFRVTYKIAYGFKDLTKDNFDDKYLIITSTSAPYSFYEDAPTVSYRNHQVGINTKDFSADSTEGQKEVLIIQDNGSYNLVVFKGAEQRITLNLTERTFTAITNNNKEVTINFDSGVIDGMTIDGGEW